MPITDAWETTKTAVTGPTALGDTERWLIGPYVEFRFPLGVRLDVEAIYRRLGLEYTPLGPNVTAVSSTADNWQFPVLLKWAFLPGPVKPFVEGGLSFRHISGLDELRDAIQIENNSVGGTFGGGVEFKLGPVRVSPEFRYTRWGKEAFHDTLGTVVRSNLNQGDFVVGFGF